MTSPPLEPASDTPPQMIEDGFGNSWQKCARLDCDLHVVRPGKVQCSCNDAGSTCQRDGAS
jgi:hypothetical protein